MRISRCQLLLKTTNFSLRGIYWEIKHKLPCYEGQRQCAGGDALAKPQCKKQQHEITWWAWRADTMSRHPRWAQGARETANRPVNSTCVSLFVSLHALAHSNRSPPELPRPLAGTPGGRWTAPPLSAGHSARFCWYPT